MRAQRGAASFVHECVLVHVNTCNACVCANREIDRYHKNLGGVLALKTNDNNVARQVDIMERRMVKAQVRLFGVAAS